MSLQVLDRNSVPFVVSPLAEELLGLSPGSTEIDASQAFQLGRRGSDKSISVLRVVRGIELFIVQARGISTSAEELRAQVHGDLMRLRFTHVIDCSHVEERALAQHMAGACVCSDRDVADKDTTTVLASCNGACFVPTLDLARKLLAGRGKVALYAGSTIVDKHLINAVVFLLAFLSENFALSLYQSILMLKRTLGRHVRFGPPPSANVAASGSALSLVGSVLSINLSDQNELELANGVGSGKTSASRSVVGPVDRETGRTLIIPSTLLDALASWAASTRSRSRRQIRPLFRIPSPWGLPLSKDAELETIRRTVTRSYRCLCGACVLSLSNVPMHLNGRGDLIFTSTTPSVSKSRSGRSRSVMSDLFSANVTDSAPSLLAEEKFEWIELFSRILCEYHSRLRGNMMGEMQWAVCQYGTVLEAFSRRESIVEVPFDALTLPMAVPTLFPSTIVEQAVGNEALASQLEILKSRRWFGCRKCYYILYSLPTSLVGSATLGASARLLNRRALSRGSVVIPESQGEMMMVLCTSLPTFPLSLDGSGYPYDMRSRLLHDALLAGSWAADISLRI